MTSTQAERAALLRAVLDAPEDDILRGVLVRGGW